jgi:Ca-activated chloride channel family protein
MRFMKFYTAALLLIVFVAAPLAQVSAWQGEQQKPKPAPGQKKEDKKPAEDEELGQDEQAVKLGARLVTVPFNVTDKKNRYINDLTKDDLEILEDNKPQEVFSFERQTNLPITIAMLIDVSGSQSYTLPAEKAAGLRFFRKVLRPNKDLGAVVSFEHEATLVQNLTSDVEKLESALDEVQVSAAASVPITTGTPPINTSGAGSTALYDAVYSVSGDLLRREAGRRVIILITDGVDTSSRMKMREAIERTWRNEIIIYSVGIGDPSYGGIDQGGLKKLAAETGGRAFFPRSEEDLDRAFAQIDEDLRSQYVLSYSPTNDAQDGTFRVIQLRAKNRKDLTVRHRRGYFAPKEQ